MMNLFARKMTRPSIEFGMSYHIPAMPTKLPLAIHPDFKQIKSDIRAWMRPYLIGYFRETADHAPRSDSYLELQHDLWGAVVYPHCHSERFFAVGVSMIYVTLLDDAFSAPIIQNDKAARAALLERLNGAIDGQSSTGVATGTYDRRRDEADIRAPAS
jgi:hypothetical protein